MRSGCVLIVLVVGIYGCVPRPAVPNAKADLVAAERRRQYERAAVAWFENWTRLARVGSRLLVANANLCTDASRFLGWTALRQDDLPSLFADDEDHAEYLRVAVADRFLIGDTTKVIHVVSSSPAAQAGVRAGDLILSRATASAGQPMEVTLLRNGQRHAITISYARRCPFLLSVLESDEVVALADGSTIQVTTGMLRFAESDEDLAAVLSHELAHNLLAYHVAHLATMRYELEADYVAVYLAARGGFEISGTAEFMRRWGASSPREIDRGRNHPGTAERVVRIEAAVREVEAKQRRGEDLVPDGLRLTAGR